MLLIHNVMLLIHKYIDSYLCYVFVYQVLQTVVEAPRPARCAKRANTYTQTAHGGLTAEWFGRRGWPDVQFDRKESQKGGHEGEWKAL